MASIRKQGNRYEIRECLQTPQGPRQRALVRFDRVLTPDVLDQAEAAARKPFDREAVRRQAQARGIPVTRLRESGDAHRLLAHLRAGGALEPTLVAALQEALAGLEASPVPEHLEDAFEWAGRSEAVRGRGLRGLLRTASRVAQSRAAAAIEVGDADFPHFSSGESFAS